MASTTLNLPLYRVLTDLKVPEDRAREAAEAAVPDLSDLIRKNDLATALDGLENRIGRMVAERADAQTKWFTIVGFSGIGLVLSAIGLSFVVSNFLLSPHRLPPQPPPAVTAPAAPR
ncbi:hypothetical protein WDZ11_22295 (plasmid) [Roseomonas mucosa]|uniref:hypothetical protein n=1 Tax=Roseomonas mucosa TaxID=207340 RepID=UPI0030D16AC3